MTQSSLQRLRWNLTITNEQICPDDESALVRDDGLTVSRHAPSAISWRHDDNLSRQARGANHTTALFSHVTAVIGLLNSQVWKSVQWSSTSMSKRFVQEGHEPLVVITVWQHVKLVSSVIQHFILLECCHFSSVTLWPILTSVMENKRASSAHVVRVRPTVLTATRSHRSYSLCSRRLPTCGNTTNAYEEPAEARAAADGELLTLLRELKSESS